MLKVKHIGSNMTEIQTSMVEGGCIVLISYETPVAANVFGKYYKTSKKWSRTTSNHITKWLEGIKAEEKPQEFFDNLLN